MLKLERHSAIINYLHPPGITGFGVNDRGPSSSGKLVPELPRPNGKYYTMIREAISVNTGTTLHTIMMPFYFF